MGLHCDVFFLLRQLHYRVIEINLSDLTVSSSPLFVPLQGCTWFQSTSERSPTAWWSSPGKVQMSWLKDTSTSTRQVLQKPEIHRKDLLDWDRQKNIHNRWQVDLQVGGLISALRRQHRKIQPQYMFGIFHIWKTRHIPLDLHHSMSNLFKGNLICSTIQEKHQYICLCQEFYQMCECQTEEWIQTIHTIKYILTVWLLLVDTAQSSISKWLVNTEEQAQ